VNAPNRLAYYRTPNTRERFEAMYTDYLNGLSYSQIAEKHGLTRQRVQQVLREKATPDELAALRAAIDKRESSTWLHTEIRNLLDAGNSCRKVSEILNCGLSTVKRISVKRKREQAAIVS
jgi:transposase